MMLLLFLFQEKPAEGSWQFYIWTVVLLVITNAINYYINRPKTESEILKNLNDIIKTNVDIIEKIQKTNEDLFTKFGILQSDSQAKSEKLLELEEMLELSQNELGACLEKCEPYNECIEVFEHALELNEQIKVFLQNSAEAVPLLERIGTLSEQMATIKARV